MINTFFGQGTLDTPAAMLASLLIGIAFGFVLERAGFGSSRRLAGIFYFRDMAVLKVMFTAVVVAMLGLSYAKAFGWVTETNVYFLPAIYAAQIAGGLIFGVGFVMSGWCPGTGAVGLASGKVDALVFLFGAVGGSMLYNVLYPVLSAFPANDCGVIMVYDSLGMSEAGFALVLVLAALGGFWGSEWLERKRVGKGELLGTPFLKVFSAVLLTAAIGLFAVAKPAASRTLSVSRQETELLQNMQSGLDHIDPSDLADRLLAGDSSILLIDIRTPEEFARFHIRSAINVQPADLPAALTAYKNQKLIVLYSNGMTHPAQARDSLTRLGFDSVYLLTDGIEGFMETCLKPVSLRSAPASSVFAKKINAWRTFFLAQEMPAPAPAEQPALPLATPGLAETGWLAGHLRSPGVKIIDLRSQPDYNSGHIPGSLSLNMESLRGLVTGLPSSLLPAPLLSEQFSLMGILPDDLLILVCTDKLQDAALAGMACERIGHSRYALLSGGFPKWTSENRPLDTLLPAVKPSVYPVPDRADSFTVTARDVLAAVGKPETVILDVRPADYYSGKKQDEARGGHIPGAINRPYTEDVIKTGSFVLFKPSGELAQAYAQMIPAKDTPVIVHCRTGHQAGQTWFVLTRLLGYSNVKWYDAGWTEWAARPELPTE